MRREVARDLTWSQQAFLGVVWPLIRDKCGGGIIQPVENVEADILDMLAGIDAWQICYEHNRMRGIASRIQQPPEKEFRSAPYPYNTFSIRYRRPAAPTEYEKRLDAIRNPSQWLYPHLTIQAYLDKERNKAITVAVIKTHDLYEYAARRRAEDLYAFKIIQNHDGSSSFFAVTWRELGDAGLLVAQWPPPVILSQLERQLELELH